MKFARRTGYAASTHWVFPYVLKIMIVDDQVEMGGLLRSALNHLTNELVQCADRTEVVTAFSQQSRLDEHA